VISPTQTTLFIREKHYGRSNYIARNDSQNA
jgi:hypothetical protein